MLRTSRAEGPSSAWRLRDGERSGQKRDRLLAETFDCSRLSGVRSDEELDGFEQILELLVVLADFSFERGNLRRQLSVLIHQVSNTHESPDNIDTHAHRPGRVQHRSQHDCAVLGEGVRQSTPRPSPT